MILKVLAFYINFIAFSVSENCVTLEDCIENPKDAKTHFMEKYFELNQIKNETKQALFPLLIPSIEIFNELVKNGPEQCKTWELKEPYEKYLTHISSFCGNYDPQILTEEFSNVKRNCLQLTNDLNEICAKLENNIEEIADCNLTAAIYKAYGKHWEACVHAEHVSTETQTIQ